MSKKRKSAQRKSRVLKSLFASAVVVPTMVMGAPLASADGTMIFVDGAKPIPGATGTQDAASVFGGLYTTLPGWVRGTFIYDRSAGKLTGPNDPSYDDSVNSASGVLAGNIKSFVGSDRTTPVAVVTVGEGADVAARAVKQLADEGFDAPFVYVISISNPQRNNGGILARFSSLPFPIRIPWVGVTVGGPSGVTTLPSSTDAEVTIQYDGISDFPKYPLNALADLNAIAGYFLYHSSYDKLSLDDPTLVYTYSANGQITDVMKPVTMVPILTVLHGAGLISEPVAKAWNPLVQAIIETAYNRTTVVPDHADGFQLLPTPEKFRTDLQNVAIGAQETGKALGQLARDALSHPPHLPLPPSGTDVLAFTHLVQNAVSHVPPIKLPPLPQLPTPPSVSAKSTTAAARPSSASATAVHSGVGGPKRPTMGGEPHTPITLGGGGSGKPSGPTTGHVKPHGKTS